MISITLSHIFPITLYVFSLLHPFPSTFHLYCFLTQGFGFGHIGTQLQWSRKCCCTFCKAIYTHQWIVSCHVSRWAQRLKQGKNKFLHVVVKIVFWGVMWQRLYSVQPICLAGNTLANLWDQINLQCSDMSWLRQSIKSWNHGKSTKTLLTQCI